MLYARLACLPAKVDLTLAAVRVHFDHANKGWSVLDSLQLHVTLCAVQLMGNLDFPQAVEEIKQAAKWLKEQGAPKVSTSLHLTTWACKYVRSSKQH